MPKLSNWYFLPFDLFCLKYFTIENSYNTAKKWFKFLMISVSTDNFLFPSFSEMIYSSFSDWAFAESMRSINSSHNWLWCCCCGWFCVFHHSCLSNSSFSQSWPSWHKVSFILNRWHNFPLTNNLSRHPRPHHTLSHWAMRESVVGVDWLELITRLHTISHLRSITCSLTSHFILIWFYNLKIIV